VAFSDIIGHKEIIKALKTSLVGAKTGHAYLFMGPAGVGKKMLARELAKNLLCLGHCGDGEGEGDLTGQCESCRLMERGLHPDFIPISPIGNSIKIEQLRELQRNAYLAPVLGTRKIFFFPDAELLTEAAANSFLKILEDPPAGVVFLFTAVRIDHILPTIRSRCQVYQLFPVPPEEITIWLKQKGLVESEAIELGLTCQGCPGAALNWNGKKHAQSESGTGIETEITIHDIFRQDLLELFKIAVEIEKKERPEVLALFQAWQAELRQNMVILAQTAGGSTAKIRDLLFCTEKLTTAMTMIESNVNLRLVVEEFFLAVKVHAK
jgi:DNA polymerase III subunit delta'